MMDKDKVEIKKLSPSRIYFINECKLRYLRSIQRKGYSHGVNFNKHTFLGIVIHKVIEEYLRLRFPLEEFEKKWDYIIRLKLDEYKIGENLEYIKYHVPYFAIKKKQTLQLLIKLGDISCNAKPEEHVDNYLISGFADLIEFDESRVKITDFKTGPIWQLVDGRIHNLKQAYITQLKTYGLVYWRKGYSADNIECVVLGLSKDEEVLFTFNDAEYEGHESFLIELRDSINEHSISNSTDSLANTSSSSCMYCDFAVSCVPLLKSLLHGVIDYSSILLIDEINSEFDDQRSNINISTNGGVRSVHRIPESEYQLIKRSVTEDKLVLLTNLHDVVSTNIKNWTYLTTYDIISK